MMREAFLVDSPQYRALRALNYAPAVEALRHSRSSLRSISIGSAVSELGKGYATVFARIDAQPEYGVELLSQSDMFAAEPAGRWIRRDSMSRPDRHLVRRWQILVAGAGTLGENELYGRPVIADARLAGKYVGQDTLAIAFDPPGSDLNLYTYAFLASPSGLRALRSTSYGTKILRIRKDILAELPIPLPDDAIIAQVAELIRQTVVQRERFAASLTAARGVIEKLPEVQEAQLMCGERRARCTIWKNDLPTMSAWTYASTGSALQMLLGHWKTRVRDVVPSVGMFNGPRFARIPVAHGHGIEFMNQRDAFLMKPVPRQIAHPGFDDLKLFVPRGSILIGGHGTLGEGEIFGRTVYVTDRLSRSAFTQDLLRVQPVQGAAALVFAFFSTDVGLRLLRSCAVGTKILSLRLDLLEALPIPDVSETELRHIEASVEDACHAFDRADQLEYEATRIIEREVLPRWLA